MMQASWNAFSIFLEVARSPCFLERSRVFLPRHLRDKRAGAGDAVLSAAAGSTWSRRLRL